MKWFLLIILAFTCPRTGNTLWKSVWNYLSDGLNQEYCNDDYISPNFDKLESDLNNLLFGQNIVIEKVIPLLKKHFTLTPKKALVICLHGWTGSGKNYAVKIIIDNLYKKKSESKFVQMYNGRLHFPIDEKKYVNEYKMNIQNWIRGNVTQCPRSLFVFDEVDKIPGGILDGIKPYMDYHDKIDSVDFRKSIFIFISNIGGGVINQKYAELWRLGNQRKNMKYADFEPYLRRSLYNTKGGLRESSILANHLVSLYLPFLPLEEEQVRECIVAEMKRQNIQLRAEKVEEVLNEMEFNHDRFSTSGCKRVTDLVAGLKYDYFDEL